MAVSKTIVKKKEDLYNLEIYLETGRRVPPGIKGLTLEEANEKIDSIRARGHMSERTNGNFVVYLPHRVGRVVATKVSSK